MTIPHTADQKTHMRLAIAQAALVPRVPFGAILIDSVSGQFLAGGHNRSEENPTWHGEIDALNACSRLHPKRDLSTATLFTTAEPCPMCMAALLWARVGEVVYGTSIPYLLRRGWWQINLRASEVIARSGGRACHLVGGVLEAECNSLFDSARA